MASTQSTTIRPDMPHSVFSDAFLVAIQTLVNVHHSIYPRVPPQGIYFETLVEEAFKKIKEPYAIITAGGRNQPRHDLLVENSRISLKTETGLGTRPTLISITKLCTTEREPWEPAFLKSRTMEHLSRYDFILMLRSIWKEPLLNYQLVDIPITLLKLIDSADLIHTGRRKGRQSVGADVYQGGEVVFHVHFDGSDGKCQIRNLRLKFCELLLQWQLRVRD